MLYNALSQAVTLVLAPAGTYDETDGDQSSIDIQDYEGVALCILNASAGTGTDPTLDVTIEESADDSTFTEVTDGAFAQVTDAAGVEAIALNVSNLKRYLRVTVDIGGTTPDFFLAAEFVGIKKVS